MLAATLDRKSTASSGNWALGIMVQITDKSSQEYGYHKLLNESTKVGPDNCSCTRQSVLAKERVFSAQVVLYSAGRPARLVNLNPPVDPMKRPTKANLISFSGRQS